jgi:uncharacterized membrane protein YfcA
VRGPILTVPIFVYVLDFGAKEAIASSLAVVGVTSLFGALEHRQEGHIKLRVALVFGVFAMVGAYSGSRLAVFFSGAAQLIIFAMVMLIAAFFMLRDGNPGENGEDDGSPGAYAGQMVLRLAAPGMAVGGSFAGTYLARFLSGMALKRAFAVFLVLMAVFILYENREVLPFG